MYSIVIQLGAIACLPVYFRSRLAKFLATFPRGEHGDRTPLTHPLGLTAVAFVVTAIPSFLLTKVIGKHLESLPIIGWSLLIGAVVMWIVDALNARWEAAGPGTPASRIHTWKMEDMSMGQAVWIGFCQIFSAVFPGTSRSMATIAGGQVARRRVGVLVLPLHPDHARCHSIYTAQVCHGQGSESYRGLADRSPWMARSRQWIRGVIYCCLCFSGVVYGLRSQTRVRAVCCVSHHRRDLSAGVRLAACGISKCSSGISNGNVALPAGS